MNDLKKHALSKFCTVLKEIETKNKTNKEENDIMMNGKNAKEMRMETLRNAGISTDSFFDLNLRVPFGAEVKIVVDGKEMVVGQPSFQPGISSGGNVVFTSENGFPVIPGSVTGAAFVSKDPIVQNIVKSGYVFNSRTDGRFVTAQTFKMLNEKSYNWNLGKYEFGWDAYLRNCFGYMYQFDMMIDELHRLAKMERSNDPEFARLSSFFTKEVVYETGKHYLRQLKKYIKNQPTRKCKGVPYARLNKYGDVFLKDLDVKVFRKMELALFNINNCKNYTELEKELKAFVCLMVKLPYNTPKCSQWKDAFKGKGAYVTLLNIVKFHGVTVQNYETGEILDTYGSVAYVESLLDEYRGQYWKFHELLKATIELNKFDLRKSIEAQK
jgi:hypothetical protein